MPISRRIKTGLVINLAVVLAAGLARVLLNRYDIFPYNGLLSLVYLNLLLQWFFSIRRRFIQRDMRRILTAAALMMILWRVIRFVKYEIVPNNSALNRHLWYAYYIALTMLPVLMFLAVMYVGKTDGKDIPKVWKLLYIPVGVIIAGVLTNDIHQRAFGFLPEFENWNRVYSYEAFYYGVVAVFVISMTGILVVVIKNCGRRGLARRLWLPAAELALGLTSYIWYAASLRGGGFILGDMYALPEFTCLFLVGFWESFVLTGLIPSNICHDVFFRVSSIRAGLTDGNYRISLRSAEGDAPTPEQIKASECAAGILMGEDMLLKCRPVRGGHFYWMEDISELNILNRRLLETGDYLLEEHAMLETSAKIEEERARVREQNALYDSIAKSLHTQLDTLSKMFEVLPEDEEEFRRRMKYAGILSAYIKRKSNLILLSDSQRSISSEELGISIGESLEYVRLFSAECYAQIEAGHILKPELALFLYDMFQAALEAALPETAAVFVKLSVEDGELTFFMDIGFPRVAFDGDWNAAQRKELGGTIRVESFEDCELIIFKTAL